MQLGQFAASVSVEGVELTEFAVEYSADGIGAIGWIPSESGKQFHVKFKNMKAISNYRVSGTVFVDGIDCGRKSMVAKCDPRISTGGRDSVATSPDTRRPLIFSKQALTDDDAYLNAAISPDLGTIKVVLTHVKPVDSKRTWGEVLVGRRFETPVLHERSKKAMGHSVQFGPEFYSGLNRQNESYPIKDLVTFIFKYRPIELLRAEGIAPPAPREEMTVKMDVDADEAHEAEIKKLEARLVELKNKKKQVKQEPSEVKIKTEEPTFKPAEVIDLT
ncbi:hypothetical protein FB451DRAFT_1469566 [Mycena latifolia]|nr:hypothetical protein FB451DRAFT_1469566 [Mycena latifolia]